MGPVDRRWLWRETHRRDPDGNRLCLYRAGENRLHPPWRIDEEDDRGPRVAVPWGPGYECPRSADSTDGPTGGLTYGVLETAIASRIPDQAPTWSDVDKGDAGSTGGREAEGVVEPIRDAPESLRDRQRVCFGGG